MNRSGEISNWLLNQIQGGNYKVGDKIPSEYELADRFSVNKTTANKAVAELVVRGYLKRGRGAAGTVVIKNTVFPRGCIGFYLSLGKVSYFTRLLAGVQQGAFNRSYTTQFFDSANTCDQHYFAQCLRNSGINGLAVSHLNWIPADLPFPVIFINDIPGGKPCNWVAHNNLNGGYKIGRHLTQLGHRKTVFVRQNGVARPLCDRYEGFCKAMSEVDEKPCSYVIDGNLSSIERLWERIRTDQPEVTAVACDGDNVALKFCHYLHSIGLRVPEDVSVSGFSCLEEIQSLVSITSIDEKPEEIGYHSASLLIDLIEGNIVAPITETIPLELRIGSTTRPPRTGQLPQKNTGYSNGNARAIFHHSSV